MTRRALLVSSADPYPVVTNGCARLVSDYQSHMFPDHDVSFLLTRPGDWAPLGLFHQGRPVGGEAVGGEAVGGEVNIGDLIDRDFDFVLFIGFKETELTRQLAGARPSFCLTDTHPHPDLPDGLFRGILTHRSGNQGPDLLLVGGSYDDQVFHPDRRAEDLVLSVGRIHPDKNQLDLVRRYREVVYEHYGLPLHLVGGVDDLDYFHSLEGYVDGEAVVSTIDPACPSGATSWRSGRGIAELCNRARLFVSASPKESFGMALIEAMACGTTCVVNGDYWGFAEADLGPHVYGNTTAPKGSVIDLVAQALLDDVRIDGSEWARRYSLGAARPALSGFIDERL